MKVAIITHGIFFNPEEVLSGNSIRGYYFSEGLVEYGIEVLYLYPSNLKTTKKPTIAPEGIEIRAYNDVKHLKTILRSETLDAIFVGYYELIRDIPQDIKIPIITDLPGPRILEMLFQMSDSEISEKTYEMIHLLKRAEHFVVGTTRQKCFLTSWLIMSGFGINSFNDIDIIPLSTKPPELNHKIDSNYDKGIHLVYAGVKWPWRNADPLFEQINNFFHEPDNHPFHVHIISGKYVYCSDDQNVLECQDILKNNRFFSFHDLMPYNQMENFLYKNCHIGIEYSEKNIERVFSQSFRMIEYLKLGIPVICSYYLEIADLIAEYDAGWIIRSPIEIKAILMDIANNPEQIKNKAKNAELLVNNEFDYRKTIIPLVSFIANRQKNKGNTELRALNDPDSISMVPIKKIHGNSPAIVIVTRPDIFPPNHGAAVAIERIAWAMSFQTPVFIITSSNEFFYQYVDGTGSKIDFPDSISLQSHQDLNTIRNTLQLKGVPEGDMFFYYPLFDQDYLKKSLFMYKEYNVSIFQSVYPIFTYPVIPMKEIFGCKVVMVEHNIEYNRIASQYSLNPAAKKFMKDSELFCCDKSDLIITVSENDRNILINDGIAGEKIHYIPHGVNLDSFDNQKEDINVRKQYLIPDNQPVLVYHGTYLYPPNVESVKILSDYILPIIHENGIYPKVLAIGPHPPVNMNFNKDIIFTGAVDCVAPWIAAADIAVVPLTQGGGTRMKVLDYFAASLPVVATSKGIEGIPVENNHEVIICDDWKSFASAIIDLIINPDKRANIGERGRKFVEQLDWRIIGKQYFDLITSVI